MSLRAIWIVSFNRAWPLYVKYFPTTEARNKSELHQKYVKIPNPEEFVKSLLLELGFVDEEIFVDSRDSCDKPALYPALQLNTQNGLLWPVVVLESRGLIFCALPHETNDLKNCRSLADLSSTAIALEVLHGLSLCLSAHSKNFSLDSQAVTELNQYVSISIPFGRPVCCDPAIASQLAVPFTKGKMKKAMWNPVPHKGKSQIIFHIREEVSCMQFGHLETQDVTQVYGSVTCKAEVEGVAPDVSVVMPHPAGHSLSVSSTTGNIETKGTGSHVRFKPSDKQPLCCYTVSSSCVPPIIGQLSIKVHERLATINLKLHLNREVKNNFQQLESFIPFPGHRILRLKPNPSQGTINIRSKNEIVWNIGTKFPSKSLEVTLNCVARLQHIQTADPEKSPSEFLGTDTTLNTCAVLLFKIADYTYSKTKIDPQTIMVTTAPKVRCVASSEFASGIYKIWNMDGAVPVITDPPFEELKACIDSASKHAC